MNEQNAILKTLSQSLNSLLKNYNKMIANNNEGGALNTLKNIEMIIHLVDNISRNENLSTILDDLSKCWGNLNNTDDIAESIGGKKK